MLAVRVRLLTREETHLYKELFEAKVVQSVEAAFRNIFGLEHRLRVFLGIHSLLLQHVFGRLFKLSVELLQNMLVRNFPQLSQLCLMSLIKLSLLLFPFTRCLLSLLFDKPVFNVLPFFSLRELLRSLIDARHTGVID